MTEMKVQQALEILQTLETWCAKKPGRRVTIGLTPKGWRASLDEVCLSYGEDLTDALGQVATVAALEG